ncbi:MAG: PAS domain-containing protein [Candidatus Schekmanbacteria bacterium]|nr:PAS domain-containing protein [Candidatus Schekmanbacteria bacterium]
MANLSFFTSRGGELLYNFFYLAACLIVIVMLFSEWKRTGTKDKLYLLNAFVGMLINLIFVNLSLASEIFFGAPPSYFWYPVITLNLQALTLIFITGAFIYPVAREKLWLKKFISYNLTLQGLGFCIVTPLWLTHYYVLRDYNKFWGAYYYNIWLFLILATTVLYLHFYAAEYYQDTLLRVFLGILLLNQGLSVWKIFFPDRQFTAYIILIERTLPLAASFTLVLTIYKSIVSSLIKAYESLDITSRELDQANQELEKRVLIRTMEISETNKELWRFKEFHENVLESLTNGILVVNSDSRIMAVNRAALNNFHLKNRLIMGERLALLLPPPNEINWEALCREVINTEKEKRLNKIHFTQPPEDEIIVNILAQPLKDKELRKIGMVLTIEFITEKIQLESQVRRSEKLAYMGQIAAGVAHEIRNPLNSISINLQLLRRNLLKKEKTLKNPVGERLRIVDEEILRLDGIVNEFLQFARPKKIKRQSQDINRIIDDIISLISEQARQANVTIIKELDKKIPLTLLDEAQIKQVFLNISINSMQAMAPQGGPLVFKTQVMGENGLPAEIVVSISDKGKGMNEKEQKKIFEPFFSSKEDGLGLGLAIASQIIEEHRGAIKFASRLGEGTTFIITVPVVTEEQ